MTLNSSRLIVGQGLVSLLQGVQNGTVPLYGYVKLGSIFDPTPYTAWAEVTLMLAKSKPAGSGGNLVGWRIEDDPIWCITSGWDYEQDSTAAMINMLTAMDILVPILHSHYQIPNPNSPSQAIAAIYSLVEWDQNERARPVRFPNGKVYLLWDIFIGTRLQYNVSLINP